MGYKGIIRSYLSLQREREREAKQYQRELEQRRKEFAKMEELEKAQFEVSEYENYIDVIKSIHKDCGELLNWQEIKSSEPPEEPQPQQSNETRAREAFDNYVPSFFDKLFHRTEKKKAVLFNEMEKAKEADRSEYSKSHDEYLKNYQEWEVLTAIAKRMCDGDTEAYIEAIKKLNPFEEIEHIGSSVKYSIINEALLRCDLNVQDEKVIPTEEKFLLKNGKLSVKKIPTSKFYELYQDYVCGCILRIARELLALLPIEMALINAHGRLVNAKTGHVEDTPILSVAIPRRTLIDLNFDAIDPSDAMKNFVHRMTFKKGQGFNPVEILNPVDFQK
jgi:hypothetical protein